MVHKTLTYLDFLAFSKFTGSFMNISLDEFACFM